MMVQGEEDDCKLVWTGWDREPWERESYAPDSAIRELCARCAGLEREGGDGGARNKRTDLTALCKTKPKVFC